MLTRKGKSISPAHVEPGVVLGANSGSTAGNVLAATMDRRTFLKRSGLAAGGGAIASQLRFTSTPMHLKGKPASK